MQLSDVYDTQIHVIGPFITRTSDLEGVYQSTNYNCLDLKRRLKFRLQLSIVLSRKRNIDPVSKK